MEESVRQKMKSMKSTKTRSRPRSLSLSALLVLAAMLFACFVLIFPFPAEAQTSLGGGISSNAARRIAGFGSASLPTTCAVGDVFVPSGAPVYIYLCTAAPATWSAVGSSGGTVTSVGNGTIGTLFTASWANPTTTPALSLDITNQGTTTTVLHGNAAGHPTFGAVVSNDLNITTTSCTNQFLTAISSTGTATCSTITLAGAQFANQGTTTTLLHGNAAGNPSWTAVSSSDLNLTTTTCTNQFVSAISSTAVGTCTTPTLAGAQYANQGTTTTLLHGNAAGNPSWASVGINDVSGSTGTGSFVFATSPSITTATLNNSTTFAATAATNTAQNHNASTTGYHIDRYTNTSGDVIIGVEASTNQWLNGGAGYTGLLATTGVNALNMGTNSIVGLQVDTSQNVRHVKYALTAGTMTYTNSSNSSTVTHRFDWTNAMVTALGAATTGDITICTLPANVIVNNVLVVIDTPDTSSNALTIAVGRTSATYIDYIVASDAKAAANTVYGDVSGERGTNLTGYDLSSPTATTAVKAHFIKTTSNLNTVTASTGHIYVTTTTLP